MPRKGTAGRGELEFDVLNCLWESGPLSTREVYERVGEPRSLAYTTILTVLQRLRRKGWVGRDDAGKAHVYSASLSRSEFASARAATLAESLARLGEVGVPAFLSHAERVDPRLVENLRRSLADK
jgi:predicted transcriptional regulator